MNTSFRAAALVAFVMALGSSLDAQFDAGSSSLRGQINASGPATSGLFVELYRYGDSMPVGRADAGLAGSFEFARVPPGEYQVRVTDFQGNVITEQSVRLIPPSTYMTIELPGGDRAPAPSTSGSGRGVVSLAELQHKVPSKAIKEFEKATKAADKGDDAAAIAHLEKAIEIDPAYVDAYNNLGARYLRAQQFEKAAEQFQKALELDENCQPAASNLGLTYIALQRFADAEKYARQAIKIDATSNRARLVLGIALAAQNREPDEALQNLKAAARELPDARLALAQFLSDHGEKAAAAGELRKYLQSPASEAQDRPKLEAWLAELEHE